MTTMDTDGAHMGLDAKTAVDGIIGSGEVPDDAERRSPAEMREWLEAAEDGDPWDAIKERWPDPYATDDDGNRDPEAVAATDEGYMEAARRAGKQFLAFLDENKRWRALPGDDVVDFPVVGESEADRDWQDPVVLQVGLDTVMRLADPERRQKVSDLHLSGYQWGWAVNAAKYALGMPPVENPAIMVVGAR